MHPSDHHGLVVLDKPVGITSRDAVDRAAGWFPRKTRLGHTGTLDPLASGVLVLCVGHATRLTAYVQDMPKTYVADVVFGARSATDDAEGPIMPSDIAEPPSQAAVEVVLADFVGRIEQVPPAFSAAKIEGRRSYDLARQGTAVELAPRTVRIDGIGLLKFDYPRLRLDVRCGKGTYIRSLARDLGDRLGCGAYLAGLRRTRVGPFSPDSAVPLDSDGEFARGRLLPMTAAVANLRRVVLDQVGITRLRNGQAVRMLDTSEGLAEVAVMGPSGELVAIATSDGGQTIRPNKVFPA